MAREQQQQQNAAADAHRHDADTHQQEADVYWQEQAASWQCKSEEAQAAQQAAAAETATAQAAVATLQRKYAAATKASQLFNERIAELKQKHNAHSETLQCLYERTAMENEDSRSLCVEQQSFIITCTNAETARRETLIGNLKLHISTLQAEVTHQRTAKEQALETAEFAVRRIVRMESQAHVGAVKQKTTTRKQRLEDNTKACQCSVAASVCNIDECTGVFMRASSIGMGKQTES